MKSVYISGSIRSDVKINDLSNGSADKKDSSLAKESTVYKIT